jgi:hypothetical protein
MYQGRNKTMNKKIIVIGLLFNLLIISIIPLPAEGTNNISIIEKTDYDFLKVNKICFNWGEESKAITLWDCWTEKPLINPEFNIESGVNNPAAYIKGSKITVKVKFVSQSISNAQIKATGTFGGFPPENVTFQNHESDWIFFTCNEFTPFEIKNQSVSWSWLLYNTSTTVWDQFDSTNHTVYLLNKEPIANKVWEKLADWTSTWCTGLSDDMDLADAILNGFVSDKYIRYGTTNQNSVARVLRNGNGLCGDLSMLFYDACGTQGVTTIKYAFYISHQIVDNQLLWNYMVITNPGLGREQLTEDFNMHGRVVNNTYPYPNYYGPGSKNDDVDEYTFRAWQWDSHAVNLFEYNGTVYLYDLSYKGKYKNVFDSIPDNVTISSSEVPLFIKNYFEKAVDFLHGRVFYCDKNGNKNRRVSLDINTSIIPDKVNGIDQIMFTFYKFNTISDYSKIVEKSRVINNYLFYHFLEKFPIIEKLVEYF